MASRCGPILGASQMMVQVHMIDDATPRPPRAQRQSEKRVGAGTSPLRIRGRKVTADIAFSQSTEDRIDQRMNGDIGVAMAGEAVAMRNENAAKPEFFARFQAMHIEPHAGAADQIFRQ